MLAMPQQNYIKYLFEKEDKSICLLPKPRVNGYNKSYPLRISEQCIHIFRTTETLVHHKHHIILKH